MRDTKMDLQSFFTDLGKRNRAVLMLDYDGTLAPFSIDRSLAFPYPGVRERLQAIASSNKTRLVVISGRSIATLLPLLRVMPRPEVWGSYGFERLLSNGLYLKHKLSLKTEKGLRFAKVECSQLIDGRHMEVKPFSLAIHYRGVDAHTKEEIRKKILDAWQKLTASYDLQICEFSEGIELRIKDASKALAVRKILTEEPQEAAFAYVGDDLTDEEAFKELGDRGLKVLVEHAQRQTCADEKIKPGDGLLQFLDHWIEST